MMGEHRIGERPADYKILEIPDEDAIALQAVVDRLQSTSEDWRQEELSELEGEQSTTGTGRIALTKVQDGRWKVEAHHVIGVIHAGATTIEFFPKIPLEHLMYFAEAAEVFPKSARAWTPSSSASSLRELVTYWFIEEVERLLTVGLARDYVEQVITGETWGGTLDVLYVTDRYYQGAVQPRVTTDLFSVDSPLNRVLRAAVARVASAGVTHSHRARRMLGAFAGVGPLRSTDLRTKPARNTKHYRDAWRLATQVLGSVGRSAQSGQIDGWSFVLSTPDLVERGIRTILQEDLGVSTSRQIFGEGQATFSPDLVFGDGIAVGDVKYKVSNDTDWTSWRSDLYQSLAFATAARVHSAVIVRFSEAPIAVQPVESGDYSVAQLVWPVGSAESPIAPIVARDQLGRAAAQWWLTQQLGTKAG
jgi:5-methylcytosine-specific restriction enzyme subunit McrC